MTFDILDENSYTVHSLLSNLISLILLKNLIFDNRYLFKTDIASLCSTCHVDMMGWPGHTGPLPPLWSPSCLMSPGHLVTFPQVSPHWSLLPWWRPDQIRTKCCDRVSRECWVTSTVSWNTGSGVGACPGDAKTNILTLFNILCYNILLSICPLKWERGKCYIFRVVRASRRRYFLYPVCVPIVA